MGPAGAIRKIIAKIFLAMTFDKNRFMDLPLIRPNWHVYQPILTQVVAINRY